MRLNMFGPKILGVCAAVLLLAACETTPEGNQAMTGTGTATPSTSASAQPAGPTPGSEADLQLNVGDRVFFDFNKYDLKPTAHATAERQAAWLKKYPNVSITIEGNCDERGTREYNLALGERRANSAKTALVSMGVDANRIKTISYGKERPVALGSNEAAWSQNRNAIAVVN